MSLNSQGVIDAVASHALGSGWFDRVNAHEPKAAPGNGLSAAVWVQALGPQPAGSGLASTSARLVLNLRIYSSMLQEPQDAIDPNVLNATDALMAAYSGDFTLGGLVRCVDLLGRGGVPLSAQAGYINMDSKLYRVVTITLPVVIDDVWEQVN